MKRSVRNACIVACLANVVLVVWAIKPPCGDEVDQDDDQVVHTLVPKPRPHLPRLGGLVESDTGLFLGDAVVTLTPIGDPRAEITAITDSSGWWSTEVAPGRYRLGVFALDYLPQITEIELPSAEEVVTRLVRGGTTARGTVRDFTGRAIDGARVVFHDDAKVAGVAIAGGDGAFAVTLAGSYPRVVARAEGHLEDARDREPGDIELRLMPGISVQGVVVRSDGEPCHDADVQIEVEIGEMYGKTTHVRTDEDGRFSAVAAAGAAKITAAGPGCSAAIPLRVQLAGPREVRLVADVGYRVSGRVVTTGNVPISDTTVTLESGRSRSIATTADGWFVFEGVPASSTSLSVTHPDHPSLTTDLDVASDQKLTLELAGGRTIRGRVEPPTIAKLEFELDEWDGEDPVQTRVHDIEGTTAADGSFTLRGVPEGKYTLRARTTDGQTGRVTLEIAADREGVRIPLLADGSATLTGRVVDEDHLPVAGLVAVAIQVPYDRDRRTVSDADGRFRFEHLSASSTSVYFEGRDRVTETDFELTSGATTNITTVVRRKDAVIRGRVVSESGPTPGVWVIGSPAEPSGAFSPNRAMTREDGSFELAGLQRYAHLLTVESPQGDLVGSTRAEPDSTVTIAVTRRHELVVIATRDGKPLREYHLSCTSERGGGFSTGVRSADGSYRGHLRLVGPLTCFGEADGTGAVVETDGHRIELTFERLAIASGRVPPGSRVVYRHGPQPQGNPDEDLFRSHLAEVDAAGNFKVDVFRGPGTITIRDDAFRIRLTYPVTGTPNGRIDLGPID